MSICILDEGETPFKQASQQVRDIAKHKISQPEAIILCLEDNSDWVNATTRSLVLEVCPYIMSVSYTIDDMMLYSCQRTYVPFPSVSRCSFSRCSTIYHAPSCSQQRHIRTVQ